MARKRRKTTVGTITRDDLSVRDELLLRLINGTTKAGVQPDEKKEENRKRARRRVELENDE